MLMHEGSLCSPLWHASVSCLRGHKNTMYSQRCLPRRQLLASLERYGDDQKKGIRRLTISGQAISHKRDHRVERDATGYNSGY